MNKNSRIALVREDLLYRWFSESEDFRWDISEWQLSDAIAFMAARRLLGNEELTEMGSLLEASGMLGPSASYSRSIIRRLVARRLIWPSPNTPDVSLFLGADEKDDIPARVYIETASWVPPSLDDGGPGGMDIFKQIEATIVTGNWPVAWIEAVDVLHREIAVYECVAYFEYICEDHGFEPQVGKKTIAAINKSLNTFSVGQTFGFMWRAVKDAASMYLRRDIGKREALNYAKAGLTRMPERAIADHWDVKAYKRNYDLDRSEIAVVLFDVALKMGDAKFLVSPVPCSRTGSVVADV